MNNNVFISCAVTGSGDTASKHPDLPKTPEQIAKSAIEAAKAGAAAADAAPESDGAQAKRPFKGRQAKVAKELNTRCWQYVRNAFRELCAFVR